MATRKKKKVEAAEKLEAAVIEETVEDQVDADAQAVAEITAETEAEPDDKKESDGDDKPEGDDKGEAKLEPKFSQAEGQRFVDEFGEIGAVWFVEGITFEQAQERQLSQLKDRLDDLLTENIALKSRIEAADFGESEGVEFSNAPADTGDNADIFEAHKKHLPRAAAAFATRFEVDRNNNGRG